MNGNNTKELGEKLAAISMKIDSSKKEILNCKGKCHEIGKTEKRIEQWEAILDEIEKIEDLVKDNLKLKEEKTK